jgi:hypothetical protein
MKQYVVCFQPGQGVEPPFILRITCDAINYWMGTAEDKPVKVLKAACSQKIFTCISDAKKYRTAAIRSSKTNNQTPQTESSDP